MVILSYPANENAHKKMYDVPDIVLKNTNNVTNGVILTIDTRMNLSIFLSRLYWKRKVLSLPSLSPITNYCDEVKTCKIHEAISVFLDLKYMLGYSLNTLKNILPGN